MDLIGGSSGTDSDTETFIKGTIRSSLIYLPVLALIGAVFPGAGAVGLGARLAGAVRLGKAGAAAGLTLGGLTTTILGMAEEVTTLSNDAKETSKSLQELLDNEEFRKSKFGTQVNKFKNDLNKLSELSKSFENIHYQSGGDDSDLHNLESEIQSATKITPELASQLEIVMRDVRDFKSKAEFIRNAYESKDIGILRKIKHYLSPVVKYFDDFTVASKSVMTLEKSIKNFREQYSNIKEKAKSAVSSAEQQLDQLAAKYREKPEKKDSVETAVKPKEPDQSAELPTKPTEAKPSVPANDVIISDEDIRVLSGLPKAAQLKYFAARIKNS